MKGVPVTLKDRIHFLGSLAHDRVTDLLRAADGFIQTSLFEGQSNSILEAMHEGMPIICSDIPMQRETVCTENGDTAAMLVPLDEFEGWRNAVLRLRDDRDFAQELGARAARPSPESAPARADRASARA